MTRAWCWRWWAARAGLVVAFAGVKVILALAFRHAEYVPISALPSLPVLGFAFAVALATGLLFGTVPAWIATKANPAAALHGANRSTRDRSGLLAEGSGGGAGDVVGGAAERGGTADAEHAEDAAAGFRV